MVSEYEVPRHLFKQTCSKKWIRKMIFYCLKDCLLSIEQMVGLSGKLEQGARARGAIDLFWIVVVCNND